MKTAALLLLSSAATVQGGAHMSKACDGGCAMQGQGCLHLAPAYLRNDSTI